MAVVTRFEYHEPESIAQAVDLATRHGDAMRFLAGGTDLIVQMRRGKQGPRHVVSLDRVPGLADIGANGGVTLGARVTHRAIERHPGLQGHLRALVEGARVVGGHQIRNVGTVGGNVVNASPAADVVPPLLVLDAAVTVLGADGERVLPLDGFATGPGRTVRHPHELLTRIAVPAPPARSATAFLKAGRRRAMEISLVCVAVRVTLDAALERCVEARIALGAVAPTALRARAAERALEGQVAGGDAFARAGRLAAEATAPISDVRASAAFRRHLVATLVPRALAIAQARAVGSGS